MLNKIFKSSFLLSILLAFSCNSSDEQNERQLVNCLSTGLQNGIVAFYPFDNGSINDESGNNYNLTNSTTAIPGEDRIGNVDCAFQFDSSTNEFLEYSNPTFLNDLHANDFSISFWYKTNSNSGYGVFMSRDDSINCTWTIGQWSIDYVDDVLFFGVNGAVATPNDMINLTDWEHIVVTATGTDLKFYRNGILSADEIDGYLCNLPNPTLNQGDLFIGKDFDGLMDDIIIYDRLLSDVEITELYNLTPCCS